MSEILSKITGDRKKYETKVLFNTRLGKPTDLKKYCKITRKNRIDVPENFLGRYMWKDLLSPVQNQNLCMSCWGFSSVSVLADRFNIQSQGKYNLILSATPLIICGHDFENPNAYKLIFEQISNNNTNINIINNSRDTACYGNSLYNAFQQLYLFGTTTEECIPYNKNTGERQEFKKISSFHTVDELPLCPFISGPYGDMCSNFFISNKTGIEAGDPARMYRAFQIYGIEGIPSRNGSELLIREEIYKWGPVSSAIKIYPDFFTFDLKNKIYEWDGKGKLLGGHAIEIVGWGETDGILFWQIKNSWGTNWGDDGYFNIRRGVNECDIENHVITAIPDFFSTNSNYLVLDDLTKCNNKFKDLRYKIDNNINVKNGGIDPDTGFSRRVMKTFFIDFSRPVPLESLPDFNIFIAGGTVSERVIQNIIQQQHIMIENKDKTRNIIIFNICIFLIIVIVIGLRVSKRI